MKSNQSFTEAAGLGTAAFERTIIKMILFSVISLAAANESSFAQLAPSPWERGATRLEDWNDHHKLYQQDKFDPEPAFKRKPKKQEEPRGFLPDQNSEKRQEDEEGRPYETQRGSEDHRRPNDPDWYKPDH